MPAQETLPAEGLMKLGEWCASLGISTYTADRWRRERGLPILKIGRQRFVDVRAASAWLRSKGAVPAAKSAR